MDLIEKGITPVLVERTKRISAMLMKLIKTRSEKFLMFSRHLVFPDSRLQSPDSGFLIPTHSTVNQHG
jgi:hypothetical protein